MWFKNLQIYRLPANWAITADALAASLATHAFAPCTSMQLISQGWAAPRDGGLVHSVNRQFLLSLKSERKLLPSSVINQVARARAAEQEEAQGFAPGKKAMKELKERVADELLPQAFSIVSTTSVWIDPINGWLAIDSSSPNKADDVIKLLLKAVDKLPLESLRVQRSPVAVMTNWLDEDEAPAGFSIDRDATMRATGESKATVRYVRHTLEADDIRRHIAAGKQCTQLAMTWNDKISFVLTEGLDIKSIRPLDVIKESNAPMNNDDRFDSDMALMTGELAEMLADLVDSLGGEVDDLASPVHAPAQSLVSSAVAAVRAINKSLTEDGATAVLKFGDGPDPMYDQAVAVVRQNRRVSISLVQRHLKIRYNRAAHLIHEMETLGIVSKEASDGTRALLAAPDGEATP